MKISACLLAVCVISSQTNAFLLPQTAIRFATTSATRLEGSAMKALGGSVAAKKVAHKTTLAGNILPVLKKCLIGPTMARTIVHNVVEITHWVDLVLLGALAFGASPLAKITYDRFGEEKRTLFEFSKRAKIASLIEQVSMVALSVYAVDVLYVCLSTIGFHWVNRFDLCGVYAKLAYTIWGVLVLLDFKTAALCRMFKVTEDNMGKVGIPNRIINGIIVALSSLVLFDWLSIKMGIASKNVSVSLLLLRIPLILSYSPCSLRHSEGCLCL
jgi:hypothetical protein